MPAVEFNAVPLHAEGRETAAVGVIVIQEWWGLNNHIRNITARYAAAVGGIAVAPDLYRSKVAATADEASHLMNGLDWHQAVKDVKIAIEYLRTRGVKKVGIVGFCMGGALAIAAGVHVPELSAGICFYGIPPAAFASPADLKPPMQFHFGSRDKSAGFSDLTAAENLKKAVADAGKDVSEFYIWDADHAFMNEEAPAYPYNEPVAKQAFAKSVDFFKKHLA